MSLKLTIKVVAFFLGHPVYISFRFHFYAGIFWYITYEFNSKLTSKNCGIISSLGDALALWTRNVNNTITIMKRIIIHHHKFTTPFTARTNEQISANINSPCGNNNNNHWQQHHCIPNSPKHHRHHTLWVRLSSHFWRRIVNCKVSKRLSGWFLQMIILIRGLETPFFCFYAFW